MLAFLVITQIIILLKLFLCPHRANKNLITPVPNDKILEELKKLHQEQKNLREHLDGITKLMQAK